MSSHLPDLPESNKPTITCSWDTAPPEELKKIKGICFDIDDTLSTQGKLTTDAYSALWELKKAGFFLVPVTGRPAGWCDHFARFWPIHAVIGENGAFTFFMDQGVRKRIDTPAGMDITECQQRLKDLKIALKSAFPKAQWASDQSYREYDLAVDICEDVPAWPSSEVQALLDFCSQREAHAKLSSIHVNIWFGEYDKRKGFEHWLKMGSPGLGLETQQDEWIYIGDSPNDEPMFKTFKYSVGVANISRYLSQLKSPPTWMTQEESGKGFAQLARRLIHSRLSKPVD